MTALTREERVERARRAIAYLEANPDQYETILFEAALAEKYGSPPLEPFNDGLLRRMDEMEAANPSAEGLGQAMRFEEVKG